VLHTGLGLTPEQVCRRLPKKGCRRVDSLARQLLPGRSLSPARHRQAGSARRQPTGAAEVREGRYPWIRRLSNEGHAALVDDGGTRRRDDRGQCAAPPRRCAIAGGAVALFAATTRTWASSKSGIAGPLAATPDGPATLQAAGTTDEPRPASPNPKKPTLDGLYRPNVYTGAAWSSARSGDPRRRGAENESRCYWNAFAGSPGSGSTASRSVIRRRASSRPVFDLGAGVRTGPGTS